MTCCRSLRLVALLFVPLLAGFLLTAWLRPGLGQGPQALPQPAPGGTRGPSALLFRPDGRTLYVAEQDENRVAVVDPDSGQTQSLLPSGGEQPVALALSPDGRTLVVANRFSGSLGIIDVEKGTLKSQVALRGEPCGVAITRAGQAFVGVSALDEVAVVNLAKGAVTARIPVGRRPRALLLTPDGNTVLCANLGGSLSLIDVASRRERARLALPAVNLRGLALSAGGDRALVVGQQAHNDVPTERPEAMWSNVLMLVRLTRSNATLERVIALDQPENGAADPYAVVPDPKGRLAFVALGGTHEVATVPLIPASSGNVDPAAIHRVTVGANPRALALRPHSDQLWVANHLGNSLTVLNTAPTVLTSTSDSSLRWVDLGTATPSPNRRLPGRFLFASAHLTRGRHFSCETCHPDFTEDGLSWKFAHIHDQIPVRNTRDLRGNLLLTPPYGWSGREEDFEVFVNDELEGLTRTHRLAHRDVHAFWDLVNETPLPPNPYRNPDGSLTATAERGKVLFNGAAGCIACHAGDEHGGTAKRANVGTTPEGVELDVPHLKGVYSSAPYLHDGRAPTLEAIFTQYNPKHLHGQADQLKPAQLHDLLEFVREF